MRRRSPVRRHPPPAAAASRPRAGRPRRRARAEDLHGDLQPRQRVRHAPDHAARRGSRAHGRAADSLGGVRPPRDHGPVQGRRPDRVQHDDRRLSEHDLREAGARRGDREGQGLDRRSREGRPAGRGIQLLRAPRHGGLLRSRRPGGRGLYGLRLRAHEGPSAASRKKARARSRRCGRTSRTSSRP